MSATRNRDWMRQVEWRGKRGRSPWRSPLTLLIMAASIPVLLFAGWIGYQSAEQGRQDARVAAASIVERVAERVRAEMMAQIQVAQTLALSATLDGPDLAAFYKEAQALKDARQLWFTIELDGLDGQQLINLLRPFGDSTLGPTADRSSFDQVLRTRQPVVGGIGPIGTVSGRKLVTVRVPVVRDGQLRQVLTIGFDPDAISSILGGAGIPQGWVGIVVDGSGRIIATTVAQAETLGQPASPEIRGTIGTAANGRYRARSIQGLEIEVVFQNVPGIGQWSVHLGAPESLLDAPVRASFYALAGGVAASLVLALGLSAMTHQDIARRRDAENRQAAAALTASERQGALAVEAADLGTWRWDASSNRFSASIRTRLLLRLPPEPDIGRGWAPEQFWSALRPEEASSIDGVVREALASAQIFELDVPLDASQEEMRWLRIRGRASSENADVLVGVVADVTLQKRAEADRIDLLRRLADAQEQIQARIARELHDQVGQTVTGLSLGLKSVELMLASQGSAGSARHAAQEKLRWLQSLASKIGHEIHQAAVDLRPTALDDLGLSRALQAHIADWSRRFGVEGYFQSVGLDTERLPSDVETALYRAAQEALTNVIKHARADSVSVVLERRSREVRLVVEDDGIGFDQESADLDASSRIGLSGMKERLHLIGGSLRIESKPGSGTSLFICVPLVGSDDGQSPRADGDAT